MRLSSASVLKGPSEFPNTQVIATLRFLKKLFFFLSEETIAFLYSPSFASLALLSAIFLIYLLRRKEESLMNYLSSRLARATSFLSFSSR